MRIKGLRTITEDVEIDVYPVDAFRALKGSLLKAHGLLPSVYLYEGKVVRDVEWGGHTHHIETVVDVESPTAEIVELLTMLRTMEQLVRQLK
jgi:hypothetical protein